MSSKKGKKRRIVSSDDDDNDAKTEHGASGRDDTQAGDTPAAVSTAAVTAVAAAPAAAAAAAAEDAPAADENEKPLKQPKPPAAAADLLAVEEKTKTVLKHAKEAAFAKVGALMNTYEDHKLAFRLFKSKEPAQLEKLDKERQQLIAKGDELHAKCKQYEEVMTLIHKAVASDDPAQINRAVETDPTTIRISVNRAVFPPPMSPQRPPAPAAAAAADSPAKLAVKFRNAPPDAKQVTLDYIRRNGAWFISQKRQPDPNRPCRACGALEHWTNDATVKPETPNEGEWTCPKVRQWALPPVRQEAIEVE